MATIYPANGRAAIDDVLQLYIDGMSKVTPTSFRKHSTGTPGCSVPSPASVMTCPSAS